MIILAIETSCDETAISVLKTSAGRRRPEFKILSNIVSSQVKVHAPFWGVVPNLAKREHQKNLPLVLIKALKEGRFPISNFQFPISKHSELKVQQIEKILEREPELLEQFKKSILSLKPPKIDIIAVTHGPGLEPALWVGVNFAKALGFLWKKPIIGINHLEGHALANWLAPVGKK
ncbi:MAG: O-sialoglycoprotein endopeptidase (Glycoprotease), partial [Candidatus Azambacteria bacterium GW2011_GWB2_46_37]